MLIFFLCLSFACFTLGVTYAIRLKRENRIPWQSFLLIILIVTAFSMWLVVLPLVRGGSFIYKPLYAAFYVLESAVGNVDYSLFAEALDNLSFWRVYTIFLHLLMPLTAYGVILSYFMKAFGWFQYTLFRGDRKIILFSELTDKSRAYAARITAPDTLLIFCNTPDGEKERFGDDSSRNMIFTDQTELQVLKQLKKQNLTIMEMGDDEDRNLQKSVEIIRYLTDPSSKISEEDLKTINIYTVSSQAEAATILDNIMGRGTENRLPIRQAVINEYKKTAFKLLLDKPLYNLVDENTKSLDIMIVGFGKTGQEVLKAVTWAGCFPGIDTNIHVISHHGIENGSQLRMQCPELGVDLEHQSGFLKPKYGEQLNPEAPIYYYSTDIDVPKFEEIIQSLSDCRYIVVSLGDDTTTLSTALQIYRVILRERMKTATVPEVPEIYVRIRDEENLLMFSTREDEKVFESFKGFGSYEDIYSSKQVGQSELDLMAKRANDIYQREHYPDGKRTEYAYLPEAQKNANQALALHVFYKLSACKTLSFAKSAENLSDDEKTSIQAENEKIYNRLVQENERKELAQWEHIRWQAYMRTEGYIHNPYEKTEEIFNYYYDTDKDAEKAASNTKEQLRKARMHYCIGNEEDHLRKISLLITGQKDPDHFYKNDRKFVDSIPEILGDMYQLKPKEQEQQNELRSAKSI